MSYPSNAFYSQELTEGYRLVHCVGLAFILWMAFYSHYVFCGEECFNLTKYENLHFAQVSTASFLIDWLLGPYQFSVRLGSYHFSIRLGYCHFQFQTWILSLPGQAWNFTLQGVAVYSSETLAFMYKTAYCQNPGAHNVNMFLFSKSK